MRRFKQHVIGSTWAGLASLEKRNPMTCANWRHRRRQTAEPVFHHFGKVQARRRRWNWGTRVPVSLNDPNNMKKTLQELPDMKKTLHEQAWSQAATERVGLKPTSPNVVLLLTCLLDLPACTTYGLMIGLKYCASKVGSASTCYAGTQTIWVLFRVHFLGIGVRRKMIRKPAATFPKARPLLATTVGALKPVVYLPNTQLMVEPLRRVAKGWQHAATPGADSWVVDMVGRLISPSSLPDRPEVDEARPGGSLTGHTSSAIVSRPPSEEGHKAGPVDSDGRGPWMRDLRPALSEYQTTFTKLASSRLWLMTEEKIMGHANSYTHAFSGVVGWHHHRSAVNLAPTYRDPTNAIEALKKHPPQSWLAIE
ncbi:hypothetical protein JX265_003313 [Neoarthrinium moseri]|uniref:Uncharacterized protein n=1 Tax=Neoarthrinium moseri TaxID=1658444 RepID=A0A9P9WUB7_9PEZI|nr:hypothetical protein JX265_003313 [Neoarthrinium moseri]